MSIQQEAEPTLKKLLSADEDTLLDQLGIRSKAYESRSPQVMQFDADISHEVAVMGPMDEVRKIGTRLLGRWSRELFKVMCGNAEDDSKDRESLLKAMGLGDIAVAGAITAFLAGLGVAPALAVVLAALLVKRIISPGAETVCDYWAEQLQAK